MIFFRYLLRYQYSKKVSIKPEDLDKIGVKMKEPQEVTLETEYEKVKQIDIDDWEMVRGE
jgi:cytochrome c oxidase assembly protein subunit 16